MPHNFNSRWHTHTYTHITSASGSVWWAKNSRIGRHRKTLTHSHPHTTTCQIILFFIGMFRVSNAWQTCTSTHFHSLLGPNVNTVENFKYLHLPFYRWMRLTWVRKKKPRMAIEYMAYHMQFVWINYYMIFSIITWSVIAFAACDDGTTTEYSTKGYF